MRISIFLFLFVAIAPILGSASEDTRAIMDSKGMPRCLFLANDPNEAIVLSWDESSNLPRKIYYAKTSNLIPTGSELKIYNIKGCENHEEIDTTSILMKEVLFLKDEAPEKIENLSLGLELQIRLNELRQGINRHINPNDMQSSEYLQKTFEPFKKKTNKKLISDYHIAHSTKLYHNWIAQKNLPSNCSDLIGSCDYYLCRETQKNCNSNGYFLGFGYQYCSESTVNLIQKVSPIGQEWLKTVATCLQEKMESISSDLTCSKIKKEAIRSHNSCYSKISFCSMPAKDIFLILKMISPELTNLAILREGMEVLGQCK